MYVKRLHPIHCLLGRCFTDYYRLIIIVCLFLVFFPPRLSGSACCYSFALWRFRPSSQSRLIIRHPCHCHPPHLELTASLNLWLSAPYVPPTRAEKPIPRSSSTLRWAMSDLAGIRKAANLPASTRALISLPSPPFPHLAIISSKFIKLLFITAYFSSP